MMKVAEELYQEGFISYPRTETDCFDPAYDLKVLPPSRRPTAVPLHLQAFSLSSRLRGLHQGDVFRHPCTETGSAFIQPSYARQCDSSGSFWCTVHEELKA